MFEYGLSASEPRTALERGSFLTSLTFRSLPWLVANASAAIAVVYTLLAALVIGSFLAVSLRDPGVIPD